MSAILRSMQEAVHHHQSGRIEAATALYRAVLLQDPRCPDALHLLGLIEHQQGRHAQALTKISQAIGYNGRVAEYHNNLGVAALAMGRMQQAIDSFAAAVKLKPAYEDAWLNWIGAFDVAGNPDALDQTLDAWVACCPSSSTAARERAAHRYGQGDIDGAIADFEAVAGQDSTDPEPRLQQGILAHERGDEAAALAAFEDARARFFLSADLGTYTVQSKLEHDIEQLEYLSEHTAGSADFAMIADRYRAVHQALYGAGPNPFKALRLTAAQHSQIGRWYNRPIHRVDCPALEQGALNPALDSVGIQARYQETDPGITVADDLLRPEALKSLRRFCLGSTIWTDFRYSGGYVGTALANGFANGLLLQIAAEMRATLPALLGPHPLRQMWAYKYDSRLTGIGPHADEAAVNINFWITPDSANLDKSHGGLVVWRKAAPLDWDFDAFNRKPEELLDWASAAGAEEIEVPYRCNRAVIFDSNLIHRTADLDFAPGFENRRINITMLFGTRAKSG